MVPPPKARPLENTEDEDRSRPEPSRSPSSDPAVEAVAVIDIGSNSIRMAIAEVSPAGEIEILERVQRTARLGQDTFRRGRLGAQTMRTAINILRDFKRLLDFYRVEKIRSVATSAVREAANVDTFRDRIYVATGIDIEIIDTSEESRLSLSALRQSVGDALDINKTTTLIADVGGGSTLLTLLKKGEITAAQSLQLGAIRLSETVASTAESPDEAASLIRQQINNVVSAVDSSMPLNKAKVLVIVGGDARFAAREIGADTAAPQLKALGRSTFDKLVKGLLAFENQEIAEEYGLSFAESETIKPAFLVYQALLGATAAPDMLVSQITMRDGVLLDIARSVSGQEDEALTHGIIQSARAVAEKYFADPSHANYVADVSVRLFDELQSEHGLGARQRLLLRVAALLHEVGGYVANRAHHKHSYYLIANAEVFGLTREEILTVAHIARYHRRGLPKPSHIAYMGLPRETRMIVSKLAAILRVADALDRAHGQQVQDFVCERSDEEFVIHVRSVADLALERRAVKSKGDLFEDVYGMKARVIEAPLDNGDGRRAKPYR